MNPDQDSHKLQVLKSQISKITQPKQLSRLNQLYSLVEDFSQDDFQKLLSSKKLFECHDSQALAIILICPVEANPEQIFTYLETKYASIFENHYSSGINNGLALRFVKAALLSKNGKKLLESNTFQTLALCNPSLFLGPFLYLSLSLGQTIDLESFGIQMEFSSIKKIDAMTLYYYGINFLLNKKYEEAQTQLLRAYSISQGYNDLRMGITHKLNLTTFLNQHSYETFTKMISLKNKINNQNEWLWDLDTVPFKINDNFYMKFKDDIYKEHARRVIYDRAQNTTSIPLDALIAACSDQEVAQETLQSIKTNKEISFTIIDGNVKFYRINRLKKAEKELEIVNNMFN